MLSVQHFFTFSCCRGTFFSFFSWNERFSKSRASVVEIKLTRVHFGSISCDDQRVSLQVVTSRGWKCFSPTWTEDQKQTQWHKCNFCHHVFTSSGVCNIIPCMLLAECTFLHVSLFIMYENPSVPARPARGHDPSWRAELNLAASTHASLPSFHRTTLLATPQYFWLLNSSRLRRFSWR